jgi:hypothetical protein
MTRLVPDHKYNIMQISEVISSPDPQPGERIDLEDITIDPSLIERYTELALASPLKSQAKKLQKTPGEAAQAALYEIGRAMEVYLTLEKNAPESLAAVRQAGGFLYRGIQSKNATPDVFVARSRDDRKPRDTAAATQQKVDELLAQAGFGALRSNSIFVSGGRSQASSYGMVHMIFPVTGAAITWNKNIYDLYTDVAELGKVKVKSLLAGESQLDKFQLEDLASYIRVVQRSLEDVQGVVISLEPQDPGNTMVKLFAQLEKIVNIFTVSGTPKTVLARALKIDSMLDQIFQKLDSINKEFESFAAQINAKGTAAPFRKNFAKVVSSIGDVKSSIADIKKSLPQNTTPAERAAAAGFINGQLADAIQSRNEVYVSGTYYAIRDGSRLGRYLREIIAVSKKKTA